MECKLLEEKDQLNQMNTTTTTTSSTLTQAVLSDPSLRPRDDFHSIRRVRRTDASSQSSASSNLSLSQFLKLSSQQHQQLRSGEIEGLIQILKDRLRVR